MQSETSNSVLLIEDDFCHWESRTFKGDLLWRRATGNRVDLMSHIGAIDNAPHEDRTLGNGHGVYAAVYVPAGLRTIDEDFIAVLTSTYMFTEMEVCLTFWYYRA